jgi:CRISPR/Cas system CMR subunit Cmr4 (Cas7 group RAMP superfamily)
VVPQGRLPRTRDPSSPKNSVMSRPFVDVGLCEYEEETEDVRPLGDAMNAARVLRVGGGERVGRPAAGMLWIVQLSS